MPWSTRGNKKKKKIFCFRMMGLASKFVITLISCLSLLPFRNSKLIWELSELLPQGKDTKQTSGKVPHLFFVAEHSCGRKGCALFEVSLVALVSVKYSSPSCTARAIALCVLMPLACLYPLSGWCSLSGAPERGTSQAIQFHHPRNYWRFKFRRLGL